MVVVGRVYAFLWVVEVTVDLGKLDTCCVVVVVPYVGYWVIGVWVSTNPPKLVVVESIAAEVVVSGINWLILLGVNSWNDNWVALSPALS